MIAFLGLIFGIGELLLGMCYGVKMYKGTFWIYEFITAKSIIDLICGFISFVCGLNICLSVSPNLKIITILTTMRCVEFIMSFYSIYIYYNCTDTQIEEFDSIYTQMIFSYIKLTMEFLFIFPLCICMLYAMACKKNHESLLQN